MIIRLADYQTGRLLARAEISDDGKWRILNATSAVLEQTLKDADAALVTSDVEPRGLALATALMNLWRDDDIFLCSLEKIPTMPTIPKGAVC